MGKRKVVSIKKRFRPQSSLAFFLLLLIVVYIVVLAWGLVGFFGLDLVAFLFGSMSVLSRIIYAVIGICGLYAISFCGRINN